jgi:hypothetical protein
MSPRTSTALSYVNDYGRIQCGEHAFSSGSCVDVLIDGVWVPTRIEHDGTGYYSIHSLPLVDVPIRPSQA